MTNFCLILHTNTITNNIYVIKKSGESFLSTHVIGLEKYDYDEQLASDYVAPFAYKLTRFIINDKDVDYNYLLIKGIIEHYCHNGIKSIQAVYFIIRKLDSGKY